MTIHVRPMVADRVRAAGGGRWPGRSRRPAGGVVALTVLLALSALGTGCAPVAERAGGIGTATRPGPERAAAGRPEPVSPATVAEPQEPPAPTMTVSFEPAPNASDVRPDTPVRVEVAHGRLTSMAVTSSSGPVPGAFASGTFTPAQPLGFGQTYTTTATAVSTGGEAATLRSSFTTLVPAAEISADILPSEGDVAGVGMPVIVVFSSPIPLAARAALAARFTVSATPAVPEGGWRWVDDTTMHWRPRTYWPPGTTVNVTGDVAGHGVGDEWFTAPVSRSFAIGPDHRVTIDAATHQMVAYENGQPLRIMPISTGNDAYPTASGIDLIMEKHSLFEMDSSSVGITGSEAYLVTVADAQRLTYSGTFIHAAPWNAQLGQANTSHGCVNASDADAAWMMGYTLIGDPVEITGTPERVGWGNGWGDWNIPFAEWVSTGSE